ncbi:OmpA family protein [Cellulosimicrobium protaetiae]|uniref:OmpA family protein n=1 Tax=Cellulosimicrobium protaetiae TaxID=2587808 RepID=UPI0022B7FB14|nr:OmpA family protein [Cellulosimicrobium protaetiae]
MRRRRAGLATSAVLVAALVVGAPVAAPATAATDDGTEGFVPGVDPLTLDDLGGPPSREDLDRATKRLDPGTATTFELDGAVTSFEYVEVVEDEVVVTLETDVLFDVDSAELSDAAVARVQEIAAELPDGVTASVLGHTDSVGEDADNLDLSQRRAQAVADAAGVARPDVTFDVQGLGESQLKVDEAGDDVADDRAQNRRVELRYSGTTPGESGIEIEEHELEPVTALYEPGDGPRADLVEDAETVVETTVVVPNDEGRVEEVRVAVEPIVVRGSVMRLRVQLTPLGPVDGEADRITVYDLTGQGSLRPSAVDPYALVSYTPVRGSGARELETDPLFARTVVDRPVRYEVYLPRPVDESLRSLYVNVVPTWPTFEDVPLVWE